MTGGTLEVLAAGDDPGQRPGTARVGDRIVDDAVDGPVAADDGGPGNDEFGIRALDFRRNGGRRQAG